VNTDYSVHCLVHADDQAKEAKTGMAAGSQISGSIFMNQSEVTQDVILELICS